MKIVNKSDKIIHIGNKVLMGGDSMKVDKSYADLPALKQFKKKGFIDFELEAGEKSKAAASDTAKKGKPKAKAEETAPEADAESEAAAE